MGPQQSPGAADDFGHDAVENLRPSIQSPEGTEFC